MYRKPTKCQKQSRFHKLIKQHTADFLHYKTKLQGKKERDWMWVVRKQENGESHPLFSTAIPGNVQQL